MKKVSGTEYPLRFSYGTHSRDACMAIIQRNNNVRHKILSH